MNMRSQPRFRFFFGSSIIMACFIGMIGNTGVILFAGTGVLITPLSQEFGWSRGEISLGLTYLTVGIALGVLLTGRLIDRYGARRVVCTSIVLSILVILSGPLYVTTLPLFYTMMLLAAVVGAPTNTIGYARVISDWFDKRRGLFIGINSAGIGLGFTFAPQICNWAAGIGGWRAGYFSLGLLLLFIVFPIVYFLLIDKPEDVGLLADGEQKKTTGEQPAADTEGHLTLGEALRTHVFWLMIIIVACIAFSLNGIFSQLAVLVTDQGIDITTAALVVSTMGASMAVARIVVGYIIDKLFAPMVALVVFITVLLGVGLLIYGDHLALYFVAAVLLGIGIGTESDLMVFLTGRYFGLRHFGTIFSWVFIAHMTGTSLGPYIMGSSYDLHGSYIPILQVCLALLALATILFAFLGRYDQYTSSKK